MTERNAVIVRASVTSGGKVCVSTSITPEQEGRLLSICRRRGMSRSTLLRELIEREIEEES